MGFRSHETRQHIRSGLMPAQPAALCSGHGRKVIEREEPGNGWRKGCRKQGDREGKNAEVPDLRKLMMSLKE